MWRHFFVHKALSGTGRIAPPDVEVGTVLGVAVGMILLFALIAILTEPRCMVCARRHFSKDCKAGTR